MLIVTTLTSSLSYDKSRAEIKAGLSIAGASSESVTRMLDSGFAGARGSLQRSTMGHALWRRGPALVNGPRGR
jgi:hypothetical protein